MDLFGLVLTVVVMLGIALAILLFERRRAREIEHDLREQAPRTTRQRGRRRGGRRDGGA
ncbi:hypothetical protein [Nocardioides sp. J54]|uniref:hypothetical protein n=1 Tax=Nocardioides sp. J54 TaxID=935866 RepID=UPI0004B0FFEB|nr:hypothetical protein [Nocardioides sp. J54]